MNQVPAMESASTNVPAPAQASTLSAQDPWPGLASYAEEDAAYFAAREVERDELLERVLQHRLTVLYGLSGLGKSSLVKAGLFPMLRTHQCLSVYVRLNFAPESAELVDQVYAALEAAAQAANAKMPLRQDGETLWEYFQRQGNAFWSQRNRLLTPVLVFDQFEEIFTLGAFRRADESKAFLEAIADLAEGRAPGAVKARLDSSPAETRNFDLNRQACHVLLSLREDYLAYLEDFRRLMPSMGNRMRLRPLSGIQAMTVVRKPGGSLVTQAVAEEIVTAVVGARQRQRPAEDQEVDPALLSLLCRELNKRRIKDAAAQISTGMLTKEVRTRILNEFYEAAIGRVTATARRFVEDKLLLASGQRDSVALEVAHESGIDDAQIDMLVDERLVRREERGGIVRLELTHDVLTDVVRASRAQRAAQEAERRLRKSRRFAFAMAVLALVSIGLLVLIVDAYYWAKNNFLPPDSMLTLQRFRLGYAPPFPDLTKKPIPPGSFEMGDHDAAFVANLGELEKHFGVPGKAIHIAQPFYLGKTEVTYDQYDYYVWQQHRSGNTDIQFPNTAQGGRGDRPVVNVSLSDAMGYVAWLGKQIGQNCRLPMEAEWEYAARADSNTAYPWGDELQPIIDGKETAMANCRGCGSNWDGEESAPVRSFAANQFGLYDMSGNVLEWTCSNWRERFDGSEQQCNDDTTDTSDRVLRGGSWLNSPANVSVSSRRGLNPVSRDYGIGFRVLCESPIE